MGGGELRLSVDKFGLLTIPQRNHEQALVLWVQKSVVLPKTNCSLKMVIKL